MNRFLLLIILSFGNNLFGQELYFKKLNVEAGLSQDDVSSVVRDSYGFIWIGTYDGLNRFDGINLESFHRQTSNPSSLPENRISALIEDENKRLWIGTQAGLFSYFSLLQEKFIRVKSPANTGTVFNFLLSQDKVIYALTSSGILRLEENGEPRFEYLPNSENHHFKSALQMPNGDIYFGGNDGLFYFSDGELTSLPNQLQTISITSLILTGNSFFVGSAEGLYSLDKTNNLKKVESPDLKNLSINKMVSDNEGNIWIGTENQGLLQMDSSLRLLNRIKSSQANPRGLLSNTIVELYYDRFNNLWIGNRQGLCYTNLYDTGFEKINLDGLNRPNVRCILINENKLILGISNEGIVEYDLETNNYQRINAPNLNYVNHLTKIDDTIFVCSNLGLQKLHKNGILETVEINDVEGIPGIRCIMEDNYGRTLIGTANGILLKNNKKTKWLSDAFPSIRNLKGHFIYRMIVDPIANQILLGTISRGLILLKMDDIGNFIGLDKESLYNISDKPVLNTSVWSFHISKDQTVWVGTDAGLFKRTPNTKHFKQVSKVGIIDKKIMSIAEGPNNTLWLSNTHGLLQFDPNSNTIRTYSSDDGLQSNSLTEASDYYKDYIFFSTTNGVNYFNPNKVSPDPTQPKLLLSNLKINNEVVKPAVELFGSIILKESINSTERLELNHLQNNISLEFSATNYSNNSRNRYRYRLDGYNDKWIYTSSNYVISYSNLDPGVYTLQLQIEDLDGNWNKNGITLPITINPSVWKTTFAYSVYAIILCLIISGFIYFWFNKQRLDHQIELDQIKINQDKELRDRQLRFFVDVGHEFKTPLSLILAPFNDLMNQTLSKEQKNMCLEIVSRNINRMNFLVNQLLDFGKISEGENLIKVRKKDLRQSIREYTKSFQWHVQHEHIDLRLNLDQCEGYFDRNVLEKGFYNVLSNAFKYTPHGGVVDISLKIKQQNNHDYAIITVSDSGPGVPDDQKEHIFERFYHGKDRASSGIGLHLAHSLIKAHGGSISVEDSDLGGTMFKIALPISRSSYNENNIQESKNSHTEDTHLLDEEVIDKGETILIVEDDPDLRNYLKISLQKDYTVLEANNGEHGLSLAKEKLPDIILSDVMMPMMDGIEMCENLKSSAETSHIPVIFLTAKTDVEYQKKGMEAGAWDFIIKPFDSEVLRKKVDNILETRNKFKTYLKDHNINLDIKSHYTSYDQKLIKNIKQVIEDNLQNPNFTVSELASEVGLSRMHLHRKLKTLVGETGKSIITRVKIKYAVSMFNNGCDRVQEAMNAVGMTNYGNFNNNFKKIMQVTATEYIAKQKENTNSV